QFFRRWRSEDCFDRPFDDLHIESAAIEPELRGGSELCRNLPITFRNDKDWIGSLRGLADTPSLVVPVTILAGETDDLPFCGGLAREIEVSAPIEVIAIAAGDLSRQDKAPFQQIEKTRLEMPCPAMDCDNR